MTLINENLLLEENSSEKYFVMEHTYIKSFHKIWILSVCQCIACLVKERRLILVSQPFNYFLSDKRSAGCRRSCPWCGILWQTSSWPSRGPSSWARISSPPWTPCTTPGEQNLSDIIEQSPFSYSLILFLIYYQGSQQTGRRSRGCRPPWASGSRSCWRETGSSSAGVITADQRYTGIIYVENIRNFILSSSRCSGSPASSTPRASSLRWGRRSPGYTRAGPWTASFVRCENIKHLSKSKSRAP